ncbi:upstream activation factor subunit spp27 isoform X1 [Cannabis sativa]|uniref:upstream activation factor subunit spp27 isoform X1 n=1 Tax=Cannabis sativa TaxID=3483 RepID=UPI0029C9DA54|nr:upstream activation factor subunit spp27 isoform X1 [Cannabis sativa]
MVSDEELVIRLREILCVSDLDTTTPSSVRRQLEADFGLALSDRKAFIREQIDIYLQSNLTKPQDQEEEVKEGDKGAEVAEVEQEEEGEAETEEGEDEDDSQGKDSRKGGSTKEEKVKKRGGFNKLCSLSPQLQEVVGEPELSRPEVVKKVWCHIRENNLQDPNNKRNIICDEPMRAIFRVKTINMFQMNKVLSKHIWPLSTEDGIVKQKQRADAIDDCQSEVESSKTVEEVEEEEEEEVKVKVKDSKPNKRKRGKSAEVDKGVKKKAGGFTKVCSLSPQLQLFIGESKLARTEVVRRLWRYIKENNLQDPKNKQNIICDKSLHTLFNVDIINMFQMNKALAAHIWPLKIEDEAPADSSQRDDKARQDQEEGDLDVNVTTCLFSFCMPFIYNSGGVFFYIILFFIWWISSNFWWFDSFTLFDV